MELKVLKNKRNGQVSITIPKSMAELYGIDEKTNVDLLPKMKKKYEFTLVVENV